MIIKREKVRSDLFVVFDIASKLLEYIIQVVLFNFAHLVAFVFFHM